MMANSNCNTHIIDLGFYSDRKYFVALIICCRKYFECLIFGHHWASEIFFNTEIFPKLQYTRVAARQLLHGVPTNSGHWQFWIAMPSVCCDLEMYNGETLLAKQCHYALLTISTSQIVYIVCGNNQ